MGFGGRLKDWARAIKKDVVTLYIAGRNPRVPWYVKAAAVAIAAYALSPIDLIPDFIPVLGYLDEVKHHNQLLQCGSHPQGTFKKGRGNTEHCAGLVPGPVDHRRRA